MIGFSVPISEIPGSPRDDAARAVTEARRLFRRTMATWVTDLLVLRRRAGGMPHFVGHDPDAVHGRAA